MSNADKRSTVTDALETLGTHSIPDTSGRDAIHLAVEPVIASEALLPGQHIGLIDGRASGHAPKKLGIADPFVSGVIEPGERLWLVVYPRQITSLRHVWSHPDFADEGCSGCAAIAPALALTKAEEAEQWLRNYAAEIDEGFETLMTAAGEWVDEGEYYYGPRLHGYHGKFEGESTHPDFWKHYQAYLGKAVPADKQHSFFTCSC